MTPVTCPLCGEPMEYLGVDDGGGDYGTSICDDWYCENCDYHVEDNCIEYEDDSEDIEG
jgi:C4-type Zn-finger protein